MDPTFSERLKASVGMVPSSPNTHQITSPRPSTPPTPPPLTASKNTTTGTYPADPLPVSPGSASLDQTRDEPEKPESLAYEAALRNEILGEAITEIPDPHKVSEVVRPVRASLHENMLKFKSSSRRHDVIAPYTISPVSKATCQMLVSPRRATRKIPKTPFKVLDAPELQDDYYLNLLDWSSTNILAVGLGSAVYLWNASTCQVSKLCDLEEERNAITSVSWGNKGHSLAVGTHRGYVQVWDVAHVKRTCTFSGHTGRVGSLAWCDESLCTGSRDNTVLQWDQRLPAFPTRRLLGHVQEVCGLRWAPNHQHLASGGNDNKLFIWSSTSSTPVHCLLEHKAAVKALAWSPHQHGLLATGGGTADRTIRFWNVLTGQCLQSTDTGSQVCNLAWSQSSTELVSTHGYSQNQIIIWRYPSLMQVAKLTGHTTRVLYLAVSPDGQTIVTGAGDETLRFWNVFAKSKSLKKPSSPLDMISYIR